VSESCWWVRVQLPSPDEIPTLRSVYQAEILRPTLRRIGSRYILIDGIVPDKMLRKLQSEYRTKVLGDVDRIAMDAARQVSKVNRYRRD
jgi:hypothetical protein